MGDLQATIEIAVELSSFHNVDLFQRGFYHIRCTLKPPEKAATSVDVEYRRNSDGQSQDESLFPALVTPSGMTAVSRTFQILYRNEEVEINDAFIFRLHLLVDSNKVTQQVDSVDVQLSLELFFSEAEAGPESPESLVSVSSQVLKLHLSCIKGIHHHIPVLFDYFHFAVVDITIHAVLTGLNLPDPSIIKPVKSSWFGVKSTPNPRISTPLFYTKLFGNKPPANVQDSRTPTEQRQIRYAYDTHRSLCSTLLSVQVNLLAYFQCLAEYLPEPERLEIGGVDFGDRVDSLINGIEAATTANDVFAQICSDLNSISLEICLVWSQFLESYTLNKRVLPYFRKEHHRQRIGHFSEAFFLQEYTWDELQIQQEQSYQLHQSLAQGIKNSRYYQSIPALVVECPFLDGDSTSNPIIFEDKYCGTSSEDTASRKEDLDEIDVSVSCHGNHGDGNDASGGGAMFLDDEELLIIENDFEESAMYPEAVNSFINEGLVLRDPFSLSSATSGRPPIRETMILDDSSDDESSDALDNGYYKPASDESAAPDDIRVTFALEEKSSLMDNNATTACQSKQEARINGETAKKDIMDRPIEESDGIPSRGSNEGTETKPVENLVENSANAVLSNGAITQDNGLNDDTQNRNNATNEIGNELVNGKMVVFKDNESKDQIPNPNAKDIEKFEECSPSNQVASASSETEVTESQEQDIDGANTASQELDLEQIGVFEASDDRVLETKDKDDEDSESSSEETYTIAIDHMGEQSKSDEVKEESKVNEDVDKMEPKESQQSEDLGTKTNESLETESAGKVAPAVEENSQKDDILVSEEPNSGILEGKGCIIPSVDTNREEVSPGTNTNLECDVKEIAPIREGKSAAVDAEDTEKSVTTSEVESVTNSEGITSDDRSVIKYVVPWVNNLLSYEDQRAHIPKQNSDTKLSVSFSDVSESSSQCVTQDVITQQPRALRDSIVTDSPSDSSVYETPLSSEATISTSESQAESSSTGDNASSNKNASSAGGKTDPDGKKAKKKLQNKGLSVSSLGSCLPVNCAGKASPTLKLSREGSVYGGSVKSRFELAKRFVKRQLHYSCQIYSDLRLERVREPYFSGERPETLESHLIVCVHGLDGNSGDLRLFRCYLEMALPSTRLDFLMSEVNQPDTFVTFEEMTEKLVHEIRHYVDAYSIFPSKVSFVGHSLGNIIIRSALTHPDMQPFVNRLHTLLSLSGPHLGMLYPTSPLVSTGLWLMQKWKKSDALLQLSLHDHTDLRQTFLYRLSQSKGLTYFKNILLVSSVQDHYVPYHSARMEMCRAAARDNSEYGTIYREMVNNLMTPFKNKTNSTLVRYSAYHGLPSSANSFIGRAAHIAMLDSEIFIEKLLLVSALDYFR